MMVSAYILCLLGQAYDVHVELGVFTSALLIARYFGSNFEFVGKNS
jgi:hypothetical protein